MKLDVKKNTIENVFWGAINKIILTVFPFLVRTIILKTLGADYIGINGFFQSILSFLNISDLGISTAIICTMYKPVANEDRKSICALMRLYRNAYRLISIIILSVGIILLPFLNFFIKGDVPENINIYILYIIYLINTVSGYIFGGYRDCLFSAHQQNDIQYKIQTLTIALQYIGQVIVLLFWSNYYVYAIFLPLSTIMYNLLIAFFSKKLYPQYLCKGKISNEQLKHIKKQIVGLMIGKINVVVRNSLDNVFISSFMGLLIVGMYSNYYMIISSVMAFIDIISVSLVAGIGNRIVTETKEKNYVEFDRLYFCIQWITGICAICVCCLIQPFISIWAGDDFLLKDMMAIISGLYVLIGKINLIGGVYSSALGLWWEMRIYSMVDIPINIFMNWFFVYKWGAYGIILATIICMIVYDIPISQWILFKKHFGSDKYKKFLFRVYKYLGVTVIIGSITYFVCNLVILNDWIKILYSSIVCLFIPNILYWIVYHKTNNFDFFISIVHDTLNKFLMKKRK